MKNKFIKYLLNNGYLPYRRVMKLGINKDSDKQADKEYNKYKNIDEAFINNIGGNKFELYIPTYFNDTYEKANYNSNINGGLCTVFIKDEDIKTSIFYGLFEKDCSPTLIHPRPNIIIREEDGVIYKCDYRVIRDYQMSLILKHLSPDLILKAMYNKNIWLNLNLQVNEDSLLLQ